MKSIEVKLLDKIINNAFGKYNGNEAKYVLEALDSENKKNKEIPWTRRLEEAFSAQMGIKYSIAHNSGTSTLHSCLSAVGVGAGDEVIVPAHTVIMCGTAALFQNAVPVYADSELDTFNISPEDIEKKITERTKAIIVVHMHGLPANMPKIMEIAKKYNLAVIEDCAQCVLGKIDEKLVGTFGDMSSFSFETKKHLSTGEGGIVSTNNEALATLIRKHGGLGYKTLTGGSGLRAVLPTEFQDPEYKRHELLGWNYRMPEIIAAVGLAQVERVEKFVKHRRKLAKIYHEVLKECEWMIPQANPKGYYHSYWTFTLRYEGLEACGVSWKEFYNLHKKNGGDGFYAGLSIAYEEPAIKNRTFYGSYLPKNSKIYPNEFLYKKGLCPVAEAFQPKLMKFKNNYRDYEIGKRKIEILYQTIKQIES